MVENKIVRNLDLFYNINDNFHEDVLSLYLINEIKYNSKFEMDNLTNIVYLNDANAVNSKEYKFYKYIFDKANAEMVKYDYLIKNKDVELLINKIGKYPIINLGQLILNQPKHEKLKNKKTISLLDKVADNSFFLNELLSIDKNSKFNLSEKILYSIFLNKCFSVFYDINYKKVKEIISCKNKIFDILIGLDNEKMFYEINMMKEYLSPKKIYMNMIIESNVNAKDLEDKTLNSISYCKEIVLRVINNDLLKREDKKEWLIEMIKESLNQQAALFSNGDKFEVIKVIENLFNDVYLEVSNFLEVSRNDNEIVFKVNKDKLGMLPLICELRKIYSESEDLNSQKMYVNTMETLKNIKLIGNKKIANEIDSKILIEGVYFLNEMGSLSLELDGESIIVKDIDVAMKFEVKKILEKAFADVIPNFYINGATKNGLSLNDLLSDLAKDLSENVLPGFEKIAMRNDVKIYKSDVKKIKKF